MTFRFENIGPVDTAEITLGDLTIIAGRNNTGKTYLAYALYGFLKQCEDWPGTDVFFRRRADERNHPVAALKLPRVAKALAESDHATVQVAPDVLAEVRRRLVERLARDFSASALPAVFSTTSEDFKDARISVDANWRGLDSELPIAEEMVLQRVGRATLQYDGNELAFAIDHEKSPPTRNTPRPVLDDMLYRLLLRFLCSDFPRPFILPTERFATSLCDRKAGLHEEPIRPHSPLAQDKLFDGINNLMGGYYRASRDAVSFRSNARGKREFDIPLHLASSSARGLADLYFYLRHKAAHGDLLIIEEPESHLDTANQVSLARMLARFVRTGIKVLITTHSDYLIKEINNLIMLSQLDGDNLAIQALNYAKSDRLDPSSVRAYVADDHDLGRAKVDEFGVDMPVFDDTIDDINRASRALAAEVQAAG